MTRERAKELAPIIKAYGDGAEIEARHPSDSSWCDSALWGFNSGAAEYRIKPTPRTRTMTRGEVLYMVTTTPGMVVRVKTIDGHSYGPIRQAAAEDFCRYIENYEYAIIDRNGAPIDGWHKFETEEA